MLVNMDMIGNRVGGIAFGSRHVVIVAGRNKIVENLEAAMQRVKNVAAPGMPSGTRSKPLREDFLLLGLQKPRADLQRLDDPRKIVSQGPDKSDPDQSGSRTINCPLTAGVKRFRAESKGFEEPRVF
jgi:hypothetical protein